MTESQLKTLKFKRTIFAQLENGGHLQGYGNEQYNLAFADVKKDRNSKWERQYFVGNADRICRTDGPQSLTYPEFIEAIKEIPCDIEVSE